MLSAHSRYDLNMIMLAHTHAKSSALSLDENTLTYPIVFAPSRGNMLLA